MATAQQTETVQLTTTNGQEEQQQIVNENDPNEEVKNESNDIVVNMDSKEKEEELIAIAARIEFEKSLLHKKIEQDVHGILDENVGWRLKDEKYKCARKLRLRFPNIKDEEMMDLMNLDFADLSNAYNHRTALNDDELKHMVRRQDDRKLIKQRYPSPVFSNKTWKLTTKSDGCLFVELIFEFALLPIYLFAQTLFLFFYLVRGELPVSGTTDLVLHDHFNVTIKGDHNENEKQRKKADKAYLSDHQLPTGYAITNIFKRERPSHTACTDVIYCCCRGIKVRDYIDAVRHYKEQTKKQKISLRIAQRQQIVHRGAVEEPGNDDLTESLKQVDSERNELLSLRGKCDRTSCCWYVCTVVYFCRLCVYVYTVCVRHPGRWRYVICDHSFACSSCDFVCSQCWMLMQTVSQRHAEYIGRSVISTTAHHSICYHGVSPQKKKSNDMKLS